MKRVLFVLAVVASFLAGAAMVSNADAPVAYREYQGNNVVRDWNPLPGTPCLTAGGNRRQAPLPGGQLSQCTPATTTTIPASTTTSPTTSTTSTSTIAPTTTSAPTTTIPGSAQFVATFDDGIGLTQFNRGVWHRDDFLIDQTQWTGDHDLSCGAPSTQRVIHRSIPAESFYVCGPNAAVGNPHMMTAMGDTSGYSVVWFSPAQVFPSVDSISFEVNLTDLGDRKWWKVGVVSDARYNSVYHGSCCGDAPGFLASDVAAADLPTSLATSDLLMATWSGGASAGYPGKLKIGNTATGVTSNPAPNDKMTRFPVSLVDNHNGTITFTVAGVSVTRNGAFPACPCRVVFADHNYTPDKEGVPQGHTWHWDSIVVR